MSRNIFAYIFRYSRRQQLILLLATAVSFPFLYLSLDLPKRIINEAIGATDFPKELYGAEFTQISYLLVLCGILLGLVFINGGFKYQVNVYRGVVGERMLRRLRYQLVERVMRFPLPHFRKTSQGQIVSMITTETEPLGGFIGDSFALPAFQGGTLVTVIAFMFIQNPWMGFAAIALYPIQAYIIPKLQYRVNMLGKERVRNVRKLSERIGELVSGAHEVHAHDTSQFELSDFSNRLGRIYGLRVDIFRKKFFIKFTNNFLAQLTPFFFFAIGGYLVIENTLTFGALVAVLAAHKEMTAPWKELLTYYQRMEDARIKYQQLIEQFQLAGMLDEDLLVAEPETAEAIAGNLVASNVSWEEDEGSKVVNGASLAVALPNHIALVGSGGAGTDEFAKLLARQFMPSGGRIDINGKNLAALPEAVTGRRISYVGNEGYIASGTVRNNLLYGLKHRPLRDAEYDEDARTRRRGEAEEAARAGNSAADPFADWVDYAAAGSTGPEDLTERVTGVLRTVDLEDDVFRIGLRRTIDPDRRPDLADGILKARAVLRQRLEERGAASLVEMFDTERFNGNASVAENILFGTPVGPTFAVDNLGENAFVLGLLDDIGLASDFVETGLRLTGMMVEIFHDLPPGHEFFERFSFNGSDDTPEFQAILRRAEAAGLEGLNEGDRARLIALPFKLVPARHHLGLIDADMQARLLDARRAFAERLPEDLAPAIQFFEALAYNAASTVQDNILFGKLASDKAESATRIGGLIAEVIEELGLRQAIVEVGLDFEVGIDGARLSVAQRQKLALARCLVKRPDMIIVNKAVSALDGPNQAELLRSVKDEMKGRSLLWVDSEIGNGNGFDHVFTMESGKIVPRDGEAGKEVPAAAPTEAPTAETPEEVEGTVGLNKEVEVLARIPLFAAMDRSKLKFIAFTSQRVSYDPGQVVFRQGEIGDDAYIVLEGEAAVTLETSEGEMRLAMIGRDELFGELALICDSVRTATIRAET